MGVALFVLVLPLLPTASVSGTVGLMQITVDTTLTEDHHGSIEIVADDVTLDCAGYGVVGEGWGKGIESIGNAHVTVRNCYVTGFDLGIVVEDGEGSVIAANEVVGTIQNGISLTMSDGATVQDNVVRRADNGGLLLSGYSLTVTGNTIAGSRTDGIGIGAHDSVFTGNHVSGSGNHGFSNAGSGNSFADNHSHGGRSVGSLGFDDRIASGTNTYTNNYCTGNPAGGSRPYGLCQEEPVGLVDTSSGEWHLWHSRCSDDPFFGCVDADSTESFYYGNPDDVPFMGNWDCDTVATPGLFRTSDAFAYLRNSNSEGIADIRFFFGNPSDIPLAGDFNGDGCDTLSIYRPSEARFYIMNKLGENEGGLGAADYSFLFGNVGDKPVVGDWDGDGIDEIGLHRESTGFFYYRNTLTTGIANGQFFFGDPGDRFVAGDWGVVDGVDTPGMFRPSNSTFYFRHTLTQGNADSQFVWTGAGPGWLPVSGDFTLD
jgi:hypothetical protein